jgi:hypothetical protein
MGIPNPDYTITWNPISGATSYTVYRSSTGTGGTYTQVGTTFGEYATFYPDTGTSSGTYWYKVSAVNGHGEGPQSAPVEVSVPPSLTYDTWTEGELFTVTQADWYTLTAGAAGTYYLQWDDRYQGSGGYSGVLMVSAYLADGTPVFTTWAGGYSNPPSFTLNAGETVYVKVEPLGNYSGTAGTYAIRWYQ